MPSRRLHGSSAVLLALFALAGIWLLLGLAGAAMPVSANPGTLYVAPSGVNNPVCSSSQPCQTLQHAVDLAAGGDTIKVAAGQYTGVSSRSNPYEGGTVTQVVYISKTVIIRGGYTSAFSEPPNPDVNVTIFNAQQQGRVFHIFGDIAPMLEGLRLTGGRAPGTLSFGGGVYVDQAAARLSKCHIYGNEAEMGGGIRLESSSTVLEANSVYSNTALADGGGVYVNHSNGAKLIGNTIFTNTAGHHGGGVYVSFSAAALNNNAVLSNTTIENGGGLAIVSSAATLNGNRIAANLAGFGGGGLLLMQSAATVNGNLLLNNTAIDGAGVYVLFGNGAVLSGNQLSDNTASRSGGGFFVDRSAATLVGNTIRANTAGNRGGGINLSDSSTSLSQNLVLSNTSAYDGGGLYLDVNPMITLTNMIIADNRINNGEGSGLYIQGSSARFVHTTLARNTGGSGRGIHVTEYLGNPSYSNITLTNTILVNQTVGVYVTSGNTVTLESTLWNNNSSNTGGSGAINLGTNNYSGDPVFALDGYHILTGSAAIDKGIDAGIKNDIDPEPRPYLAPDLGADEYWAPGALHKIYLPLTLKTL